MEEALLGGLSAQVFLRRHWQRRPLLVRRALPAFRGVIGTHALFALAARAEVESRLVERRGHRWTVTHGPLKKSSLSKAGARNWTLLVNGVNHHSAAAEALLRRFAFIPQARIDDVMVSYAVPGGGVGPHFDSYDVFLLQGQGRRIWRLAQVAHGRGELRDVVDAVGADCHDGGAVGVRQPDAARQRPGRPVLRQGRFCRHAVRKARHFSPCSSVS